MVDLQLIHYYQILNYFHITYLMIVGGNLRKEYYWELREFKHCDPDKFKEMVMPERKFIYLFKKNIPDVVARIEEPLEKIHGYSFSELEILQRLNDNPKVFHWKQIRIPFKGELILSLLQNLNIYLKTEIVNALPRRTKALEEWINAPLEDVFLIKSKSQTSFGNQHGFFEIRTLYRTRYKNYFETRSWRANTWEGLLVIAQTEGLQKNSSYGLHLNEISNFINNYEVINNQHFQDMFELHNNKKPHQQIPKDKYQLEYQRKILLKYGLHEYLDE